MHSLIYSKSKKKYSLIEYNILNYFKYLKEIYINYFIRKRVRKLIIIIKKKMFS